MCALTTYVCILQTYLFEVELMWVRAQVCEFKMSCLSLYVPVLCVCVCARVHVRTCAWALCGSNRPTLGKPALSQRHL